jgi:hypothetical protein
MFTSESFVCQITNDYVGCPEVLRLVKLTAPSGLSGDSQFFIRPHASLCRTNCASSSCINRICKHVNLFAHRSVLSCESLPVFQKNAINAVRKLHRYFRTIYDPLSLLIAIICSLYIVVFLLCQRTSPIRK